MSYFNHKLLSNSSYYKYRNPETWKEVVMSSKHGASFFLLRQWRKSLLFRGDLNVKSLILYR